MTPEKIEKLRQYQTEIGERLSKASALNAKIRDLEQIIARYRQEDCHGSSPFTINLVGRHGLVTDVFQVNKEHASAIIDAIEVYILPQLREKLERI